MRCSWGRRGGGRRDGAGDQRGRGGFRGIPDKGFREKAGDRQRYPGVGGGEAKYYRVCSSTLSHTPAHMQNRPEVREALNALSKVKEVTPPCPFLRRLKVRL